MIIVFARKGQEIGQHPEEDVPALIASGEILHSDRYWHEGMTEWVKVYEKWPPEEEKPSTPPKKSRPAAPVVLSQDKLPNAGGSSPGPLFWLISLLLIAAGIYWFVYRPALTEKPAEQVTAPTVTEPSPTATPQVDESVAEPAAPTPTPEIAPSEQELALAWLRENPQFKPRRVTLRQPREFILKRNGLVRGSTMVPAGASANLKSWDDKTVTAGFAAEPRVLPHDATDFVARVIAIYREEKDRPVVVAEATPEAASQEETKPVTMARPTKSKISVVAWNLEWYPGRSPEASPDEQEEHREAAKKELEKINPDILLAQEVANWDEFIDLCSVVPELQVAAVSHHLRGGEVTRQQTAIASKLTPISAWYDDWKRARPQPPRGYAAAVVEIPDTNKFLLFYSLHLKSNRANSDEETKTNYEQREESARQLLAHVEEMENKAFKGRIAGVIVGGDFNTNHDGQFDDDTIEMLTEAGFVNTWEDVPRKQRQTWMGSGRYEPTTFDYIMTKGFDEATAELIDIPEEASDHRPVALKIELSSR